MNRDDARDLEIQALRGRLSRLSEASLRINESLDFDTVLQGVLDSARDLTRSRYGVFILLGDAGQNAGILRLRHDPRAGTEAMGRAGPG